MASPIVSTSRPSVVTLVAATLPRGNGAELRAGGRSHGRPAKPSNGCLLAQAAGEVLERDLDRAGHE